MNNGPVLRSFFARCRSDAVFFVNSLLGKKTRKVVRGKQLIHHGQEKWLREAFAPVNVLVPGNRFGKSVITANRHWWMAFTKHGLVLEDPADWLTERYETISLAYSSEQANIVFAEIRAIARSPVMRPFVRKVTESPFPKVTLFNGSVINVRSAHDNGKYVDGFEYRYMSVDEAGYIDHLKDLMNGVLMMRLAGGGLIDLIGTPKGFNDLYWYSERGLRRVDGYYGMRGSIYDNPFLPREDIEMRDRMIANSDPRMRQQVIEGDFVDFAGLAFSRDQRENLFRPGMPAHTDRIEGHQYVQAWDLGRRTDWTVGVTIDVTDQPWLVVDFQRLNRVPWEEIYRLIGEKAKEYRVNLPRIDASGPAGDVIEEELWKRGIYIEPFRISTGQIKTDLINTLQTCLDYGREPVGEIMVPDEAGILQRVPVMEEPDAGGKGWGLLRMAAIPQMVDEMGVYRLDDKELTQDCVMALALGADAAYQNLTLYEPSPMGMF